MVWLEISRRTKLGGRAISLMMARLSGPVVEVRYV